MLFLEDIFISISYHMVDCLFIWFCIGQFVVEMTDIGAATNMTYSFSIQQINVHRIEDEAKTFERGAIKWQINGKIETCGLKVIEFERGLRYIIL